MIKIKLAKKIHPEFDERRATKLLRILERGSIAWNRWRSANPDEYIDLRQISLFGKDLSLHGANLSEANLSESNLARVDLREANLSAVYAIRADFQGTHLEDANLQGAYLAESNFTMADLSRADLRLTELSGADLMDVNCDGANLRKANLTFAHINGGSFIGSILAQVDLSDSILREADLSNVDLRGATLNGASFIETNLQSANLNGCRVFGTSIWKTNLQNTQQMNLIITPDNESEITVDNIEVAQFMYLLLNNKRVRHVIDTITSKVVLILGRFTPERKAILDKLRDALRERDYVPILFDFDKPTNEDFTGTIKTLAGMCHFVIADITNPKSSPLELQATVPDYMIPFVPIIQEAEEPFAMFVDLWIRHRDWVLEPLKYVAAEDLIAVLEEAIIQPAEQRYAELTLRKAQALMTRHTSQYRSNA